MKKRNNEVKVLAICIVLSMVLGGTVSAATMFAEKVDYKTGRCPHGIYAADFDGDGDKDVVTTNSDSSTFSYFANMGNGTFLEKVDCKTGEFPVGIYAADFNGDGDLDVIAVNYCPSSWTGTFSYFANIGDGTGTFSEKVDYEAGWLPRDICAADFDGDGDVDVAVTNSLSKTFSHFANIGDGTFSAKVDYETEDSPSGIYVADFNDDGDMDVVVTTTRSMPSPSHLVLYFENEGHGAFSPTVDYKTGADPGDIYATDFDGDGCPDIVTTILYGFSYLENNGDGTFSSGTDYKIPRFSSSIYAADFDSDGDNDVVLTNYHIDTREGVFSCFTNKGDGTFSERVDYETGREPLGIYATDFDGDKDIDVVTANSYENTFSYFENVFSEPPAVLVSNYTTKPPKMDGIISPGEWTNKIPITLNGYNHPEISRKGELYVMNDENNIYIAVVIQDTNESDADYLLLDFDQGNDHVATDGGEDAIGFNLSRLYTHFPPGYVDMRWDSAAEWWSEDLNAHGNGLRSYVFPHPGDYEKYRYEFVKPLRSGDAQDMALNLGDTIGFRIEGFDDRIELDDKPFEDWYRYPQNTVDFNTSLWDEWADLIIAVSDGSGKLMEGDANGDGCVSLKDSTAIKQYLVDERDLDADRFRCADTLDDGKVNLKDSTLIRKWLVDKSTPLWESPADDDMAKPETC